ncbi:hypothetical protein [Amycolatopsis acidicola]|uniref:hypothetical protein n=1 Tax=Amycolatopsis acidicola TaxID=2596893 RepID=UPI00140B3BE9|nr:hypothetical protein [Amycolatopsis acidicola]
MSSDLIAGPVSLYPDRLAPGCRLPQSPAVPVDASVAELRRCVEGLRTRMFPVG